MELLLAVAAPVSRSACPLTLIALLHRLWTTCLGTTPWWSLGGAALPPYSLSSRGVASPGSLTRCWLPGKPALGCWAG